MLKKLLASALAVATVASCAYVPTALASAATTTKTKTATAGEYQAYKLLNPDAKTEKKDVTLYVINGSGSNTVTLSIDADKNNVAGVEEAITADTAPDALFTGLNGKDYEADGVMKQKSLNGVTEISSGVYLVSVTEKTRYEITTVALKGITSGIGYEKVAEADYSTNVATLGYYQTDAEALIAATSNTAYKDAVKYANVEFQNWEVKGGLVSPVFKNIETATTGYTAINVYNLVDETTYTDAVAQQLSATTLGNGSYIGITGAWREMTGAEKDGSGYLYLPTSDKANWGTYVANYCSYNSRYGWNDKTVAHTGVEGEEVTYTPNGVAIVNDNGTDKAVVTYAVKAEEVKDTTVTNVTYTLNFRGESVASLSSGFTDKVAATSITTDPEAIYTILKGTKKYKDILTKDTLAEYVAAQDDTNKLTYAVVPQLTETSEQGSGDTYIATVEVTLNLVKAVKTTAYYYDENGTIATKSVYLTETQKTENAKENGTKLTAADLGIAATTTVDGYNATFKSASTQTGDVEVTYTLATIDLSNFETTTGEFNATAYFGKKGATAGSKVMLKVSLSETGVANALDLSKVTVKYQVVSATAGDNYSWTPAEGETYKAGVATDITLAEGTNIAVATVYYDKEEVGTFEAFYAIVK